MLTDEEENHIEATAPVLHEDEEAGMSTGVLVAIIVVAVAAVAVVVAIVLRKKK